MIILTDSTKKRVSSAFLQELKQHTKNIFLIVHWPLLEGSYNHKKSLAELLTCLETQEPLNEQTHKNSPLPRHILCPFLPFSCFYKKEHTEPALLNSLKRFQQALKKKKIQSLITFDIHDSSIQDFLQCPLVNIYLHDEFFKTLNGESAPLIIAPDQGATLRATLFAQLFEAKPLIFQKKRFDSSLTFTCDGEFLLKNKSCILIDDLLLTGGTVLKLSKYLKQYGAQKITACITHAYPFKPENYPHIQNWVLTNSLQMFMTHPLIVTIPLENKIITYLGSL